MSQSIVAYLGIPGSFSHTAAKEVFGKHANYDGASSFREVFELVRSGQADRAVVPIENTLAGSIYENYDLLQQSGLRISGEHFVKVEHALLVTPEASTDGDVDISRLTAVYSHPKALEQCRRFFAEHTYIKPEPFSDTAAAAQYIADQHNPTIAAIAGAANAKLYQLAIAKDHLEDDPNNYTRFLVVEPTPTNSTDEPRGDKCSVVLHLPHIHGSLYRALGVLQEFGCNMTKIESRPIPGKPFEYVFYIDFIFEPQYQSIDTVIQNLRSFCQYLAVAGIYADKSSQVGSITDNVT